jgi:hypothetical protein
MPYHLVAYRGIGDFLSSLISSYCAASLDTAMHGYLSRMASTTIPPLFDFASTSVHVRIEALGSHDNI